MARALVSASFMAALPLISSYGGDLPGLCMAQENQEVVIRILPRFSSGETAETMLKRMNSEKITIILPFGYVQNNKAVVDSMKKSEGEKEEATKKIIAAAQEKKHSALAVRKAIVPQSCPDDTNTWMERRKEAFKLMWMVFPPTLENDYGAKKNQIKLALPENASLGIYQRYVEKSIGIAAVFFYKERWWEKTKQVIDSIDWDEVRSNIRVMMAMRERNGAAEATTAISPSCRRKVRQNLSDDYLTMIAVLANVLQKLTGVDGKLLLALGTRETSLDHNNFNPDFGDMGIMQLDKCSPLFTFVAYDSPRRNAERELEDVMRVVLPEKTNLELAKVLMAGLYNAIRVRGGKQQGDITMNMIAGALTYRYKYYLKTGVGTLDFSGDAFPTLITYNWSAVGAYNGINNAAYPMAVRKYWLELKRAADLAASDLAGPALN